MNENAVLTKLIKENHGFICKIINKYAPYYEFDDLYQVSIIGIMKAYQNYKTDMNVKFMTYAYKYILSEIVTYIREQRTIKISKEYYKLYKKILETKSILSQKLMKEPTNHEISLFLELDESLINEVMKYQDSVKSLDELIYDNEQNLTLMDKVYSNENNINIDHIYLKRCLNSLEKEEQSLIKMRYFEDMTQKEIAAYLGTNQVQISRKEQKILKKLKNNLCET